MSPKLTTINNKGLNFSEGIVHTTDEYTYLRVIMDSWLGFDEHVKYICLKIYPKVKTLGGIRNFVSKMTALYIYCSLIKPVVDYADIVYDPFTANDANILQVLQNTCLHIYLQKDRCTSQQSLHEKTNVKPLQELKNEHTCKIMYL